MAGKATSEQESWWVLQAQSGSREALNELFKSVQEPLFRYVVSLVNERQLAEVLDRRPRFVRAWNALQPRYREVVEGG